MEQTGISADWLADFEAARRRPLALRLRYAKDRESLPRLRAFREYWMAHRSQ